MRNNFYKNKNHDPRIHYRGETASRVDNLTDAVFGIAITLLIFNLVNPNSFEDLLVFTKTLPAFLISIAFIMLIWNEHISFSEIYSLNDNVLIVLNTLFIALVIFYVYPLKFMTLFLTNFFFNTNISVEITGDQVPYLVIYYGFVVSALYFVLWLFYFRVNQLKEKLELNSYEVFLTKAQKNRLVIFFVVPLISILATFIINQYSYILASIIGGCIYTLYTPLIIIWSKNFNAKSKHYSK
jgi:uncharacterized membrane protein